MTNEGNRAAQGFGEGDFEGARGVSGGENHKIGRRERGGRISTPSEWALKSLSARTRIGSCRS